MIKPGKVAITATCIWCKRNFAYKWNGELRDYCDDCRPQHFADLARRKQVEASTRPRHGHSPNLIHCVCENPECGKEFAAESFQRYCSKTCRMKHNEALAAEREEKRSELKRLKELKTVEAKPVEAKPVEAKTVEAKPEPKPDVPGNGGVAAAKGRAVDGFDTELVEWRTCVTCGKKFPVPRGNQTYAAVKVCPDCSNVLRRKPKDWKPVIEICPGCGREYVKAKSKQTKCSSGCMIEVACPVCGKTRKSFYRSTKPCPDCRKAALEKKLHRRREAAERKAERKARGGIARSAPAAAPEALFIATGTPAKLMDMLIAALEGLDQASSYMMTILPARRDGNGR